MKDWSSFLLVLGVPIVIGYIAGGVWPVGQPDQASAAVQSAANELAGSVFLEPATGESSPLDLSVLLATPPRKQDIEATSGLDVVVRGIIQDAESSPFLIVEIAGNGAVLTEGQTEFGVTLVEVLDDVAVLKANEKTHRIVIPST